jgi:hypothetical protein
MERLVTILGTIAVIAGTLAATLADIAPELGRAVGLFNPRAGVVIIAAGAVALGLTKPLVDVQAKLAERKQRRARRRAANR